jgi:hypothetical protein
METKKAYKTHTSSAVKQKYNEKAYDQILFAVPKGVRNEFKAACEAAGESMASVLKACIAEYLESH